MAVLLGLGVGLCTFLLARALLGSRRVRVRDRIAPHVEPRRPAEVTSAAVEPRRWLTRLEVVFGATERRLSPTRPWRALERAVEQAGAPLRAAELLYLVLGLGLLAGLALAVATGSPAAVLFPPPIALASGWLYLRVRAGRRARAFDDLLPDLLTEVAATLRVGYSLTQALEAVAQDAHEPARKELRRALAEARLGRPLEQALAALGRRVASGDLEFVLDAVAVQRQVGGSLAGLFEVVSDTVRARHQFSRKLRALTAMGRASAYVLIALPVAMAALLTLIDRPYMRPLYGTAGGRVALLVGVVSIAIGSFAISKIVSIKG